MNKRLLRRFASPCAALVLLSLGAGCKQDVAASGQAATTSTESTSRTVSEEESATRVARIVFIGKQNACDCARVRVDDSFAALQTALGGREDIPVERLRVDVDQPRVAPYREMRAIMVLPAVYLLDGAGELIEMLQGEVTMEQFRSAINGQ